MRAAGICSSRPAAFDQFNPERRRALIRKRLRSSRKPHPPLLGGRGLFHRAAPGDDDEGDRLADATFRPILAELANALDPTTIAGALTGLEFVTRELRYSARCPAGPAVLNASVEFLKRAHPGTQPLGAPTAKP